MDKAVKNYVGVLYEGTYVLYHATVTGKYISQS